MLTGPRKGGIDSEQLLTLGELLSENRILFLGEIDEDNNALGIMHTLRFLASKDPAQPIKIEIVSAGGSVFWTLALYHVISMLNQSGTPVYTIGHTCYSGAALILAAGKPGFRYIYPEGTVMLHASAVSGEGSVSQANLKVLKKHDQILIDIICKLCCKPKSKKEINERLVEQGVELWLNAKEAKDFGLVDKIITPEIDRELFGNLILPDWKEVEDSGGNFSPASSKKQ